MVQEADEVIYVSEVYTPVSYTHLAVHQPQLPVHAGGTAPAVRGLGAGQAGKELPFHL